MHALGVAVEAAAALFALQDRNEDLMEEALGVIGLDAASREHDRRLDQLGPAQGAPPAMRRAEPGQQPWHRHRLLADVERLRRGILEVDHHLVHLGPGS